MLSDGPKRLKKTWDELTAAASTETDPETLGTILEEILAALEERLSGTGNANNVAGSSTFGAP